jgi:hypothetical protein
VIVGQNVTAEALEGYGPQWYNMSIFDGSMSLTIDINDQSRLLAEFIASVSLSNSGVWFRIVVDGLYVSTTCYASSNPGITVPVQVKILTGFLSAGQHTINVQFYQAGGTSTLLDRSLFVTELAPP